MHTYILFILYSFGFLDGELSYFAIVILILGGIIIAVERTNRRKLNEMRNVNATLKTENDSLLFELKRLSNTLKEKDSKNLKASVDPLIIKNTMDLLDSLAKKTLSSIQDFTPVLNQLVNESSSEYISLKDEILFMDKFISLYELQLSSNFYLQKSFVVDNKLAQKFRIIPMLLVNFVESAFKSTDVNDANSYIKIKLSLDDDSRLIYEVRNTPKKTFTTKSIKLEDDKLRKRVDIAYNGAAVLEYERLESECVATLIIPSYIKQPSLREYSI